METNFRSRVNRTLCSYSISEESCFFDRRNRHPRSKLKRRLIVDKKDDVETEIVKMHYGVMLSIFVDFATNDGIVAARK